MDTVRIGIIGAGFIADTHVAAIHTLADARAVAVASRDLTKAQAFAQNHAIPHASGDYHELLARPDVDAVVVAAPNYLHAPIVQAAAAAGKHVLCEKPLCLTVAEGEKMRDTCRQHGVQLVYAEVLPYVPKYVRAQELAHSGALGQVFFVRHSEEHPGPHADWFWDPQRAGGGVMLDMSCHSIEFARWVLGKPATKSVTATVGTFVHGGRSRCDDHCICTVEFEGGALALCENSWAKLGGMDDKCEIYGTRGNTRADIALGESLLTYSECGYDYAMEKAGATTGWSFTTYDELWNFGYPQQMRHFVEVTRGQAEPRETVEDGIEVLRIICAAYQSAREGRRIEWPYDPPPVARPIDLWLGAE